MTRPTVCQFALAAGFTSLLLISLSATADFYGRGHRGYYGPRPGRHYWYGPAPRFYGRAWYGGHWYHGWFGGQPSWWWIVGSSWYLYPVPVYPYPDPTAQPIESLPAPVASPLPQQSWYWCNDPAGYYPAVDRCSQPWQAVAAGAPADTAAPAGPASPEPPASPPPESPLTPGFDPAQAPPSPGPPSS